MVVLCERRRRSHDEVVDVNKSSGDPKQFPMYYKQQLLIFGFLLILLMIIISAWLITVVTKLEPRVVDSDVIETVPTTTFYPESLTLISRKEWLAKLPTGRADLLLLPAPAVIISHTAMTNCTDQKSCSKCVQIIQNFHIEDQKWYDIGYNFLVGGDGFAYEGRGWQAEGAHTYGYNKKSIGISFIGNFNKVKPPKRQITAAKLLIQKGAKLGYLAADYKVIAARQLQDTESPGLLVYEDMKTWPHWTEDVGSL